MQIKLHPPFLFGRKVTSRVPGQLEMTVVVRAVFHLRPGEPVAAIESPIDQGFLSGDRFHDDDEDRAGALVHADDFADFKLKADVLFRGACHPGAGRAARECTVRFAVGSWSKSLRVVGRRVWTERLMDPISEPAPFVSMPITYENAFGGPGYARNPAGRGVSTAELPTIESPGAPVRARHASMEPAGLGPFSPSWPQRSGKLGTDYGKTWKKTRAPYYAADFDWSFFNAAPPDQQIEGYLRGDEEIAFDDLHPAESRFRARLPGIGPRVLVRHHDGETRQVLMRLDTLVADLDAERLVLTWRGLTPVAEDDLEDVRTLYIACEALADRRPVAEHIAALDVFEADPLERDKVIPPDVKKRMDDARAAAEALIAKTPPAKPSPPAASDPFAKLSDTVAEHTKDQPPEERARVAEALAKLRGTVAANQTSIDEAAAKADLPPATSEGMIGELAKHIASGKALAASKGIAADRLDVGAAGLEQSRQGSLAHAAALAELAKTNPQMAAAASGSAPGAASAAPPEPGPGANLMGRDLSGWDLRGVNLRAALLHGANLSGAKLAGADLTRAELGEADLSDADLTGAKLTQATLVGARAPRAILDGVDLSRAILQKTDLEGASLRGVTCAMTLFVETVLTGAVLSGSRFERALFSEAKLERADFSKADISISTFLRCSCEGIVLDEARIERTTFLESRMPGASFYAASGEGTSFQAAVLDRADFRHAHLLRSHFFKASLDDARMFAADLAGSRFERASLARTDLEKANLISANFNKAKLAETRFAGANLYDAKFFGAAASARCDFTGANLKLAAWDLR